MIKNKNTFYELSVGLIIFQFYCQYLSAVAKMETVTRKNVHILEQNVCSNILWQIVHMLDSKPKIVNGKYCFFCHFFLHSYNLDIVSKRTFLDKNYILYAKLSTYSIRIFYKGLATWVKWKSLMGRRSRPIGSNVLRMSCPK